MIIISDTGRLIMCTFNTKLNDGTVAMCILNNNNNNNKK